MKITSISYISLTICKSFAEVRFGVEVSFTTEISISSQHHHLLCRDSSRAQVAFVGTVTLVGTTSIVATLGEVDLATVELERGICLLHGNG